jgi:hypothetical protein
MARGTGTHTAHTPMHSPTGEPSHPSLTKIIQKRAEEGSYIWEPRAVGLPRNGKHSLCMYSYLALGSHATVTLTESFHFLALLVCLTLSSLRTSFFPLSPPPPSPPMFNSKRMGERKQTIYIFLLYYQLLPPHPSPSWHSPFILKRFNAPPTEREQYTPTPPPPCSPAENFCRLKYLALRKKKCRLSQI